MKKQSVNILLVDDHKVLREGIKTVLKQQNDIKIVGEAENGQQAIEFLSEHHENVDVVLMDVNMPNVNGIDATRIIAKKFKNVNILALTMHVEETYIVKMIKAGALGYILKDSGRDQMVDAINMVANGKKYYSNDVSVTIINSYINDNKRSRPELSSREDQILNLLIDGHTSSIIAKKLQISIRTVETHRRNILKKLNMKNTAELIKHTMQKIG